MNTNITHQHTSQADYGTGEKTLSVYVTGILLCVALTLIPFGAVMYHGFSRGEKLGIILVSALAQFVVQILCFLRLNYSSEQARMNVMSFIFALVILLVIIAGSIWIMVSLNYRMM